MAAESSDHNVYILGAGFSKEAGAPLVNDFLDIARDIYHDPNSKLDSEEREMFRQVFEFKKRVSQSREKFIIDLDDIEQLFGLIEMSHRLEQKEDVRGAMVYVIAKTLQIAIENHRKRPTIKFGFPAEFGSIHPSMIRDVRLDSPNVYTTDIYNFFALLLSGRYDRKSRSNTVITFNYDLVLDHALLSLKAGPKYGLPDDQTDDGTLGEQGVHLLKLHGSTNWAICPACKFVHVAGSKFTGDPSGFRERGCTKCRKNNLRLLLVPPSWDKSDYRDVMRPIWQRAVDALKSATRICVIGYSMPPTDTFFKFLLTLGLAENHQLYRFVVVDYVGPRLAGDTSPETPPIDIEARYRGMFEKLFLKRRFRFQSEGFANFLTSASASINRADAIVSQGIFGG
jgi:hypothetical protein